MKVQIVHLDAHDDHVSARDKLAWAKAERVLVVWPRQGAILQRRLDLRLIQRKAQSQGATLGLVTHDPKVREHAMDLGLAVFDSLDGVPKSDWAPDIGEARHQLPNGRSRPVSLGEMAAQRRRAQSVLVQLPERLRIALFSASLIALVAAILVLVPAAQILVQPETTPQSSVLTFMPAAEADESGPQSLPAREVRTVVSGQLRAPTSGGSWVPRSPARGEVVFTNLGDQPALVAEGTGLRAQGEPGLRFVTTASALLPARRGAQATVPIEAAEPGARGNLPPDSIRAVEGPIGLQVSAQNLQPTRGGSDEFQPAATQADLEAMESRLSAALIDEAQAALLDQLEPGEQLIEPSLRVATVLVREFDSSPGDPAASLSLVMRAEVLGLTYRPSQLLAAVEARLDQALKPGWTGVPNSMSASITRIDMREEASPALRVEANRDVVPPLDGDLVRHLSQGLTVQRAEDRLRTALRPAVLEVRLAPSWSPWMPWLPIRIRVLLPWEAG